MLVAGLQLFVAQIFPELTYRKVHFNEIRTLLLSSPLCLEWLSLSLGLPWWLSW